MQFIQQELDWLSEIITLRLKSYFQHQDSDIYAVAPPDAGKEDSPHSIPRPDL